MSPAVSRVWSSLAIRRRRGYSMIRLALGLALVASIMMGGPAAAVEHRTPDAAGTAELTSLKTQMAAIAATGQRVSQDAARLLVHLADIELPAARLRSSDVITAIRAVTQASRRMSLRSQHFADVYRPSSARASAAPKRLDNALSNYNRAGQALDRASEQVLMRVGAVESEKSIEGKLAELPSFTLAARSYAAAQDDMTSAVAELEEILLPPPVRDAQTSAISLSIYGFVDEKGAENGYGLYTHVLFPRESERNAALLDFLLKNPTEGLFADEQAAINLFALPVRNRANAHIAARIKAKAPEVIASQEHYDYSSAMKILGRFCLRSDKAPAEVCSGDWQGPFLLSYHQYLSSVETVSPPYLLVDLSNIHEDAFGEFVRAVKQQVMLPDFSSREKIDTFRLQLLDIALDAADWIGPVKEGIAGILSPVSAGKE